MAAIVVTGPLAVGPDNFVYVFVPALVALVPLAMDRLAAVLVAAGLLLLFVFLEILTIGAYFLPAAATMAVAALLRTSGGRQLEVAAEVEELVRILRAQRRNEAAQRIADAVAGGATGTEALDRLHVTLGQLLAGGMIPDRPTRGRARTLRRAIGRRLRGRRPPG